MYKYFNPRVPSKLSFQITIKSLCKIFDTWFNGDSSIWLIGIPFVNLDLLHLNLTPILILWLKNCVLANDNDNPKANANAP